MEYTPGGSISISIGGYLNEKAEIESFWEKLCHGGIAIGPMETAERGGLFGLVIERYSVT